MRRIMMILAILALSVALSACGSGSSGGGCDYLGKGDKVMLF